MANKINCDIIELRTKLTLLLENDREFYFGLHRLLGLDELESRLDELESKIEHIESKMNY